MGVTDIEDFLETLKDWGFEVHDDREDSGKIIVYNDKGRIWFRPDDLELIDVDNERRYQAHLHGESKGFQEDAIFLKEGKKMVLGPFLGPMRAVLK